MQIRLNGKSTEIEDSLTVAGLLRSLHLEGEPVAVARNREVIRKADLATIRVREGDEIEVIRAVAGG
jgi:thiamine biosynthesis protein ThiS